ncbi:hypothetical protein BJ875DRAFT_541839 [Amylocarpus encephaloides]|uniref:Uncharacterized protein n=1 Tax=Amylocarpus encephaloides TaxID=45428 RepID=A0A9P7YLJ5_9HELO|nr:hypothetical protein BJ875DRAFT_541839 [Amylocarpus encephaloides]
MLFDKMLWRLCLLGLAVARPHEGLSERDAQLETVNAPISMPESSLLTRAHESASNLVPRAKLANPDPLIEAPKGRITEAKQLSFIKQLRAQQGNKEVGIVPPIEQQNGAWEIDGIPIGATGHWFNWPEDKKLNWEMYGLEGCTATFILTQEGFWGGHLWESTKDTNVGGASSFLERMADGSAPERTDAVFKKIAADIMKQKGPGWTDKTDFVSPVDLMTPNPAYSHPAISFDGDTEIMILTKAKSIKDRSQQYESKINILKQGYAEAMPLAPTNYKVLTYDGFKEGAGAIAKEAQGRIIVQFTPFHERQVQKKNNYRVAKAKVWVELDSTPAIDMTWEEPEC